MLSRKAREWRLCTSAKDWIVEAILLKHRKLITKASQGQVAQFGLTKKEVLIAIWIRETKKTMESVTKLDGQEQKTQKCCAEGDRRWERDQSV